MPILKAGNRLIYYAHVPKCGGSAVEHYLRDRFGSLAFVDSQYLAHPPKRRWTQTSPQHVSVDALERLFPSGFFDHSFGFVRHPVARLVSAYHFQVEKEKSISAQVSFSDWLAELPDVLAETPFAYDNHIRPMAEIVPDGAHFMNLENGVEAMIVWLDQITGTSEGPRAIPRVNEKADPSAARVVPTAADIQKIADIYADDFERFGYVPDAPKPLMPPPELPADIIAARDAEAAWHNSPMARLSRQARRILKS